MGVIVWWDIIVILRVTYMSWLVFMSDSVVVGRMC